MRRHLTAAKDLVTQIVEHPFFGDDLDERSVRENFLRNKVQVLDNHLTRCHEATEQTKALSEYLFSIATLEESRLAVEETKAANTLAGSIRRVTMTFFHCYSY
jgi:hypothetical protein